MGIIKNIQRFFGIERAQESFSCYKSEEPILTEPKDERKESLAWDYELDDKVQDFLDWYNMNFVKGHYTEIGEFHENRRIKDFIEKMASWYELRYPTYEILKLMPGSGNSGRSINDIMFKKLTKQVDISDEQKELFDWASLYNFNAFLSTLEDDMWYISFPKYNDLIYLGLCSHLHLDSNGIVIEAEELEYLKFKDGVKRTFDNSQFEGLHIREVYKILKEANVCDDLLKELESSLVMYDLLVEKTNRILDCVLYRIIERGGNRIGPRRGLLFAKEFRRNIDIPMMYAYDFADPGLRIFVNEYIKAGGNLDLVCLLDWGHRDRLNKPLETMSVRQILQDKYSSGHRFTDEEKELHQKLVDALANSIDQEILEKETIKQKRIERKLARSRKQ